MALKHWTGGSEEPRILINSGVAIKVVSEHLGHSDISTTGNIYADILNTTRRKTAQIIDFKLKQA